MVFNVSRRLKNLTKETNAQEEEARRLQTAAEEYLWKIQHALSSSRDQGDLRYTSGTVPAKNEKIKRRLQEEVKSFRKDFEQLKEELESLEGEGKRQKIDLVLWGKNRVKPTFEKIKETIRNHQLELNLLLQLQQGLVASWTYSLLICRGSFADLALGTKYMKYEQVLSH